MEPTDWISFRQNLHQNAELSREEKTTQTLLSNKMISFNPDRLENVGNTGLLAIYGGKKEGPRILLRADMDALPIQEINTFPYRSKTDGVSHKCGHDGHSTIMMAVAEWLHENPLEKGEVWLLFQPAEEIGWGASAVLEEDIFKNVSIDHVFALHNIPGTPLHQVIVKDGGFTPAVTSPLLYFKGRTSHAAEPEMGNNPGLAIAQTLKECLQLAKNDPNSDDMVVVTPIFMTLGDKAYGTSAGYGELHLTVRTWSNDLLQDICSRIEDIAREQANSHSLDLEIGYTEKFFANENEKESVECVRKAARSLDLELEEKKHPFKWGEDFGLFTKKYKGCMFGLGAGEDTPALHNPDYDFPDELIRTGRNLFTTIIKKCLDT